MTIGAIKPQFTKNTRQIKTSTILAAVGERFKTIRKITLNIEKIRISKTKGKTTFKKMGKKTVFKGASRSIRGK
ncbi:MAG: hypothetical protein HFG20_01490, partial [Anaerotruncus sp.]|nr:hypothetical protein [Anaerotruncus sp.]